MEGEDPKGLGPIAAHAGAEAENGAPGAPTEVAGVSDCGPIDGFNASQSQLVGAAGGAPSMMDKAEANVVGVKRKRGRPPKNQGKLLPLPPPPKKKPKEDEDVCFICFDGGSLVLCDRRDCPKAYHPACVKRDEAFFNTRAKWNCGWHICSICQKTSHYMCYTCTYSLCKACTKDSEFLCVRENKGFCTTCMGTIMLIEKKDQGDKETVHVDFDDKTSWEYLFKVYWVYMKEKLSLTFEELTRAQKPWKAAAVVVPKVQPLDIHSSPSNGNNSILEKPSGQPGAYNLREKRTKGYSDLSHEGDSPSTDQSVCENGHLNVETVDWASKELLEFVAFTKNGDVSELSHFDVQTLLLDYIKRNSLRDPRRKSQIICDSKLINLFGKVRVGHFEMLKLLEFHFNAKEDHQKDVTQGNKNTSASQVEGNGNSDSLLMKGKFRKRKTPPKGEDGGLQANLDDYAAIDVHNINLIFLRRNLLENLVKENVKFHDKVVGSIVRIRIPCGDQKQNMHRLVLVAGTCKAAEPYKIGEVTSDVMLEILNLNKKETIAIDAISNQEFSEDECKRLRQSIKYGLVKRLTVGQVLEKAIVLQEVRLNDWLEGELIRLNHLRDRASEKGQKKQLRECVEKIELLKSPEERQRRLQAAPEVHVDPNCESDEDDGLINNKKRDESVTTRYHEDSSNGWDPPYIQNGDLSTGIGIKNSGSDASLKPVNRVKSAGLFPSTGIIPLEARQRLLLPTNPAINASETEMLWNYRDPNGKVQGPFCMIQLRKWSTTGYFPLDMRVWRVNDVESDSLLMTDLLNGKVKRVMPQQPAIPPLSQETRGVSDIASQHREGGVSGSVNITKMEGSNGVTADSNGNHKIANANELVAHSSSPSRPVTNNSGVQTESQNSPSEQVHCAATSVPVTEWLDKTSLHEVRIDEGETQNSAPSTEQNLSGNVMSATTEGQNHDNQSKNEDHPGSASMPKSTDSQENDVGDAAFPNLSSPTPKANGEAQEQLPEQLPEKVSGQNLITPNLNSPAQKFCEDDEKTEGSFQNVTSPSTQSANEDEKAVDSNQNAPSPTLAQTEKAVDSNQNVPSPTLAQTEKAEASIQDERGSMPEPSKEEDVKAVETPVLNSTREDEKTEIQNALNPTPKCASEDEKAETSMKKNERTSPPEKSTNEADKVELSENKYFVPNFPPVQHSGSNWSNTSDLSEWGGYSSAGPKPSLEEWNAGLVLSSLKPPAAASSVHASTPVSGGDEFTPPSHPASTSSWQTMVAEPIEFSTLAEESVSDLLAEVEVLESQREFASSPTSRMTCIEELFEYSKSDYFNSFGGLSPPLESGRSDSSGSTGDLQLPTQLTMTIQPVEAPRADVADLQKKHDREAKLTYTSQHEPDTFLTRLLLAPCTMSGGTMHETLRPIQGGSSTQAVTDMGCAFSSGMSDLGVNRNDLGLRMKHGNMSLRQEQPTQRATNLECTVSSGMFDLGGEPNHVGSRRSTQGCTVSSGMFDLGVDPNNVGSRTTKNERTSPHVFDLGGDPNHGSSRRSTQGCNVSSGMFDLGGDPNNVGSRTTKNERTRPHERGFSLAQGGPVSNMGCTVSMGMTDLGANPNDIGSRMTNEHMDSRQGRSSTQGVPKLGRTDGQMSPRRGGSSSIQGGGNANMGWLTGHGGGNANMNRSPPAGSSVRRESHPVERHAGGSQRDRAHRGGGGGGGERSSAWSSRQSAFGGGSTGSGGGGSYPRQSPRGQRVCKFYESGYCRKGAFCDYLHPS